MIPLVKAAAMVERNGVDYAIYLGRVFVDDLDFRQASDNWAVEEVQHGDALGRWAMLIARCMVETGTSSYYTALAEATGEPVLQQVCKLIAADEYRHFKLFYDHMRRYLARERLGMFNRLRIAAGRITESEDDELAYAYHCGNEPTELAYVHERCIGAYMGRAISFYRFRHIERAMGMILKSVGLPPRGRLSAAGARLTWTLLQRRRRKFEAAEMKAAA